MADSDSTLKILIQLGVVGQGDVEAANQLIKETSGAGKGLAESMGVVNVSQYDVNKALGKGGEKAEFSGQAFKRLAHTMGSEIPGASALMEAGFEGATEPMLGGVFLLMAGIEMLRAAIDKINEEQKESKKIGEELRDLDAEHSHTLEKTRDALDEAEVAEATFNHNYIRNTQDAITKASELAQTILKARIAASESNDSTRKDIAGKEIEDMEQRGVVSHESALKMKEQLDIQYEQQKLARMIAQDAVEREIMVNQLQNKQLDADKATRAESQAEETLKTATAAKVKNDTKLDEAKEKIEGAKGIIKELSGTGVTEENIQKLNEFVANHGGDDSASLADKFHFAAMKGLGAGSGSLDASNIVKLFGSQGDKNLAMYEGAQIDIKFAQYDIKRGQANKPTLDTNASIAQSDLEAAQRRMEKDRDDAQALKDKIAETDATNRIKEGGAKTDLGLKKASDELTADRGIADKITAGGAVTAKERQQIIDDASRIAGHTVDLKTAAKVIENGANNMGIFMNQLSKLTDVMSQFNPAQNQNLQRQIDQLRTWVSQRSI